MKFRDIREFTSFLEERGELRRVSAPVDTRLEISEIADRMIKSGGPALLFENPEGYDIPVLINIFGSKRRMAWALGLDDLDDVATRVQGILDLVQGPPEGIGNKLRTLGQLVNLASARPRTISNPPCQDVVIQGDDVDLFKFPNLQCWPMDGGPYITLPLVITRDPETGVQNYGTYRMQVYDQRTTACTGRLTRWRPTTNASGGSWGWTEWTSRSLWAAIPPPSGQGRRLCLRMSTR